MPVLLNANDLRWLGEEADGRRREDLAIVQVGEKLMLLPANDIRSAGAHILVRTDLQGEGGLPGGGEIGITYNGRHIAVGAADAAFFTQSAVEKFVLPYYTRMKTPGQITALRTKLYAADVIVALHDPPSIMRGIDEEDPDEFKALRFNDGA
jgi:hypothetical protein